MTPSGIALNLISYLVRICILAVFFISKRKPFMEGLEGILK